MSKSTIEFEAWVARKYNSKFNNAKDRGIEFTITFAQMKKLLKNPVCYYTGKALDTNNNESDDYLTFDRIDNSIGYTKDNTVVCANKINRLKNILFEDETNICYTGIEDMYKLVTKLVDIKVTDNK